jgi:TPR repeat protein
MRSFSRIFFTIVAVLFATVAWSGDFKKGWNAYSAGDYATALAEWQELADSGDAKAAYGMGLLYGNGFGVDMNDDLRKVTPTHSSTLPSCIRTAGACRKAMMRPTNGIGSRLIRE